MSSSHAVTDARLAKALAHPLRARIVQVLDERPATPSDLAQTLDAPLGNVSYHVRILASLGLIGLVNETPRPSTVDQHSGCLVRPLASEEAYTAARARRAAGGPAGA